MATLTLTVDDDTFADLAARAKEAGLPVEQYALSLLDGDLPEDAGLAPLNAEEIAAIERGIAELDAGRGVAHEDVMRDLKARYGA